MWLAKHWKLPYQCNGMKSTVQPPLQLEKKLVSQSVPEGLPWQAGAPSLIPRDLRGSISLIQSDAALSGAMLLPPWLLVPSGSLKPSTCVMLTPLSLRDLTVL